MIAQGLEPVTFKSFITTTRTLRCKKIKLLDITKDSGIGNNIGNRLVANASGCGTLI